MIKLEGRTAIVTGSSSGMGAEIARALAAEGMNVMLAARRADRLEQVAGEISAAGGTAVSHPADCAKEAEVEALFRAAVERFGHLDLLVNSTGVPQATPIDEMSLAEWQAVIDANLTSVFLASREAMKLMKTRGRGRIISIGSVASQSPRLHAAAYVTAKYGLDGLTRSLALEGRDHGVAASVLHPGYTVTGFGPGADGKPGRNAMDPRDVAQMVVLMASLPDETNMLEALALPLGMPFLGRG
ncbi:MAG TPA: SDR family oxidoreductase [Caulobacteraceae bacterium]|nr:SDR family oxidoreductase [Caulobacteraceae bacterium]